MSVDQNTYPKTECNIPKQAPKRANYDKEVIHAILDEALVYNVSFIKDDKPQLIPMYGVRDGENIIFHGSRKSRFMKVLGSGMPLAISVTHVDGLVFARSAFHHSMNYRSVVIHSQGYVADEKDKSHYAHVVTNRFSENRYDEVRMTDKQEMKATDFLVVPIENVVAKVRTGDPIDDKEDMDLDVWAGVIDVKQSFAAPRDAQDLKSGVTPSDAVLKVYGK